VRRHWSEARRAPVGAAGEARGRALVRDLLREMARTAAAAGARLLVVHERLEWASPLDGEAILLDVGSRLEARGREAPIRFSLDPHWNAAGHEVVAGAIALEVERLDAERRDAER
jgi:hypothetical protein